MASRKFREVFPWAGSGVLGVRGPWGFEEFYSSEVVICLAFQRQLVVEEDYDLQPAKEGTDGLIGGEMQAVAQRRQLRQSSSTNVLMLLSGGIDSTSCLDYYCSKGLRVSALFVNYGQPRANQEREAALAIASYFNVPLSVRELTGDTYSAGYIPARNAMLLCTALMNFPYKIGLIGLGIHAGTPYKDCTPQFIQSMQAVCDLYEEGRIQIDAPFLNWTKSEIWDYAQMRCVPVTLTCSNNLEDLRPVADFLR